MSQHPEKRTVAVKVLLTETEAVELYRQADALDRPAADVMRKGWLLSTFGTVGLARRNAKQSRGSDEFLEASDFLPSGYGPGDVIGR